MTKTIKDTDYLSISTRVRSMENRLLTGERMERMLDARSPEEAAKVLTECGYEELSPLTLATLDAALGRARDAMYADLSEAVPDRKLLDVFRMKADYHNVKAVLKALATGQQPERLLTGGGRYDPLELSEELRRGELTTGSDALRQAAAQAREQLSASGDPQLCDFILDRAYFAEMAQTAQESGSAFLQGYVRLMTDSANLRSTVRARRMEQGPEFCRQVLLSGGNVGVDRLLGAKAEDLPGLFRLSPLAQAAEAGAALAAPGSGSLTQFERLCDNALLSYLAQARRIPFGEQPVIGYLCARESEFTAARIILTGLMAGLAPDDIRERLRDSYA